MDGRNKTQSIVEIALYLCLIIVSSYIKIPIMVVPITLQLVCVYVLSSVSKNFAASKAVLIYLIGGLSGLPFFTQGGGLAYFIKPHFGYLLGFLALSWTIEVLRYYFKEKQETTRGIQLVAGYLLFYLVALSYIYVLNKQFFGQPLAILSVVQMYWLPFMLSDGITLVLGYQMLKVVKVKKVFLQT